MCVCVWVWGFVIIIIIGIIIWCRRRRRRRRRRRHRHDYYVGFSGCARTPYWRPSESESESEGEREREKEAHTHTHTREKPIGSEGCRMDGGRLILLLSYILSVWCGVVWCGGQKHPDLMSRAPAGFNNFLDGAAAAAERTRESVAAAQTFRPNQPTNRRTGWPIAPPRTRSGDFFFLLFFLLWLVNACNGAGGTDEGR